MKNQKNKTKKYSFTICLLLFAILLLLSQAKALAATFLYGDVSGNGEISAYDAALTAQAAVGLITLTPEQIKAVDVSGNREVSAYDAALIAQRAVGLIDKFPVQDTTTRLQHILSFFRTSEQQFMPLGFYAMTTYMRDVELLKALHQRGIILFHRYGSTQTIEFALADLQAAREAGAAVLYNLPSAYLTTRGTEFWQQHITALAGSDLTLLEWYLPEETVMENLDKLEQLGNIIRATDTKHRPLITYVWVSDAEYLKRVSSITDAVVFGAYPSYYAPGPRIVVKQRIDLAYKNGVPVVIAALEALEGKFNWVRPKDVRFDAYLALISGAKGIMWYAYYYAKPNAELVEAVLEVATEINGPEKLGEVLLLGKEPNSLQYILLEGPTLSPSASKYGQFSPVASGQWTAREYENYLYIFAVNTAQEVVNGPVTDDGGAAYMIKVKFGPISSPSSEIQVIGENRVVDLSDGYFIDTFEPLGTHIYKVKLD